MFSFQKLNNPAGPAKLNLFCFHWAGGNGTAFKPLSKFLEDSQVAVFSVTLPGRNGRDSSKLFRRFPELVDALKAEFKAYHRENLIGDLPVILFGHSFGGMIAYELTKAIMAADEPRIIIDHVIVSAVRSPIDLTEQNRLKEHVCHYQQTNAELIEYMKRIGGIPAGVDLEIVELMLPTIKGDYEVIETYDLEEFDAPVLNCPLTLFSAKMDQSMSSDMTSRWSEFTSEEYNVVEFARGGHFYITDAATKEEFYAKLQEECEKHFVSVPSMCVVS